METMRVGRCNVVRVRETTRWRRDGTIRARPVDAMRLRRRDDSDDATDEGRARWTGAGFFSTRAER